MDEAIGSTEFAFLLYSILAPDEGNLLFSPLSIYISLAMLQLGSKGRTNEQLRKVLGMKSADEVTPQHEFLQKNLAKLQRIEPTELRLAQKLFADKNSHIEDDFLTALKNYYFTNVGIVEFAKHLAASTEVNKWIEEETKGKITDLISSDLLKIDTALIVLTALYMKADWQNRFSSKRNFFHKFNLTDGSNVQVEMMDQTSIFKYFHNSERKCSLLQLPYSDDTFSLFILLPDSVENLNEINKFLSIEILSEMQSNLKDALVNVKIPKFSLDSSLLLRNALSKLGVEDIFSKTDADLSAMSKRDKLFISAVVHKSTLDVNEIGTEASAASAILARPNRSTRHMEPVDFLADHPFLFFVQDSSSKLILFIGRLQHPKTGLDYRSKTEL